MKMVKVDLCADEVYRQFYPRADPDDKWVDLGEVPEEMWLRYEEASKKYHDALDEIDAYFDGKGRRA
jgi:hypothetical protein